MKDTEARERINSLDEAVVDFMSRVQTLEENVASLNGKAIQGLSIRFCKKCGHNTLMLRRGATVPIVNKIANGVTSTIYMNYYPYECLTCGTLWNPVTQVEDEEVKETKV